MSITEKIKNRINDLDEGEIIMTSDFADISSITTIRKCLGRCVDEGIIRRIFDGVYEKPKFSKLLNEYMPTNPENVAYALARTYHWTIAPCGDIALNKLGLTTQVPTVWSYVSDGPYRDFNWDNIQLRFKHKANREISQLSAQTILVIEALRALGKERIDADVISKLGKRLKESDKNIILSEATACSEWIYETIRKVCAAQMKNVARLTNEERQELFQATAIKMGMRPEVVEKDFWVCYMLDHLFHDCEYKDAFVFKGGTSLSKSYHVIERFSEDIDLILDWRNIIKDESNPWDERSKTKQDMYNKQINKEAALFYKDSLVPKLNEELSDKLGDGRWVEVDADDEMVVNFIYPQIFDTDYIIPHVRLEIGPLAEWMPSHITSIAPFAAEQYENLFEQKSTEILTIDVERTFWEQITILHKIANFPDGKALPHRYARHLYDVYCLGNSEIKKSAFERKELLEKDVAFKQKFYYAKSAHYETATLQTISLIPKDKIMQPLRNDYVAMANMFYGKAPGLDEILIFLSELENEIHNL